VAHPSVPLVRFEVGELICFIFPVQRGYFQKVTPGFVPMGADPARDIFEVLERFCDFSEPACGAFRAMRVGVG